MKFRLDIFNKKKYLETIDVNAKDLKSLKSHISPKLPTALSKRLTSRELEVCLLLVEGHSNLLLAEKLDISVGTIKAHRRNLYKKLEIKNLKGIIDLMK